MSPKPFAEAGTDTAIQSLGSFRGAPTHFIDELKYARVNRRAEHHRCPVSRILHFAPAPKKLSLERTTSRGQPVNSLRPIAYCACEVEVAQHAEHFTRAALEHNPFHSRNRVLAIMFAA